MTVNNENAGDGALMVDSMLTNNNSRKHFSESMLSYFNGQISDEIAVTNLCKEKAEAGDYNAMLWLARMYREGKGVINKNKSNTE